MTPPTPRVVAGKVKATKGDFELVTSEIHKHSIIRNGVQVMPKEFLENPQLVVRKFEADFSIDIPKNVKHDQIRLCCRSEVRKVETQFGLFRPVKYGKDS